MAKHRAITVEGLRELGFGRMSLGSWYRSLNGCDEIGVRMRGGRFVVTLWLSSDEWDALGVETIEDICELYRLLAGKEL